MPERTVKKRAVKQSQAKTSTPVDMSNVNKKPRKPSEADKDMQRERKRATDRQAQRMARERTKQYIAHLEKTIEILRKESGSETVTKLLQERNQLALEVQQYRKVMYGMRLTIDGAISGEPCLDPRPQAESTNGTEDSEEPITLTRQITTEQPVTTSWSDTAMLRGVPWDDMGLPLQGAHTNTSNHEALGLITLGFNPQPSGNGDALDTYHNNTRVRFGVPPHTLPTHLTSSWPDMLTQSTFPRFIPQSMSPIISPLRGHSWNDQWWQTANQSYEKIFTVGPYGSQAADMINAGTLFKAVRDGWNTLDMREQNNPVFMILREMDEKVFFLKDKVSRVALAIKSHRLMKFYLNADRANLLDLADWQRPRPSQRRFKHPIAIDFFAWPGLRDRFVQHHAQYFQTTAFSEAYRRHFKFSWPFTFEDTYHYDDRNDTYCLSPLFEKYHRDLKSWRFEESFFKKYPELLEAVQYVEADPPPDPPEIVEAPVITRARNSTAMMEAEAQNPTYGERRSVHEPTSHIERNMSLAEQVGVEGLADLWMTS